MNFSCLLSFRWCVCTILIIIIAFFIWQVFWLTNTGRRTIVSAVSSRCLKRCCHAPSSFYKNHNSTRFLSQSGHSQWSLPSIRSFPSTQSSRIPPEPCVSRFCLCHAGGCTRSQRCKCQCYAVSFWVDPSAFSYSINELVVINFVICFSYSFNFYFG